MEKKRAELKEKLIKLGLPRLMKLGQMLHLNLATDISGTEAEATLVIEALDNYEVEILLALANQ